MNSDLIKLFAPDYILEHFEFEGYEEISGVIRIYLVEKQDTDHYPKEIIEKGKRSLNVYLNPIEILTFPTQAKNYFLHLSEGAGS